MLGRALGGRLIAAVLALWCTAAHAQFSGGFQPLAPNNVLGNLQSVPMISKGVPLPVCSTGASIGWSPGNGFICTGPFLLPGDAGNLYLTKADAVATYLTQVNATATYLTQQAAANTYITAQAAANTFVSKAGSVSTGVQTAPGYTLSGPVNTWKPISFTTNGSQRWQLGSDNNAETGTSNAGSNFSLFAYADNGAIIGSPMTFVRATQQMQLAVRPTWQGGMTPYDTGNLPDVLAPYIAQTYADAHYLGIFNGGKPVLGLGPFSNGVTGNSTAAAITAIAGTNNNSSVNTYPNATTGLAAPGFPTQALNSLVQAGDSALISVAPSGTGASLVVGVGAVNANAPAGIRISLSSSNVPSIALGVRPTIAGNLVWDAGNLPSPLSTTVAASTYLTQALAATTYATTASVQATYATIAGVQSAYLRITDAAATYMTQAQGDARYIRTTGAGTPYDITFGTPGLFVPTGGTPVTTTVLSYVFGRSVTIPAGFAGAKVIARSPAAATTIFNVSSSRYLLMGTMTCAAGASTCTFGGLAGPYAFQPGDTITINANSTDTGLGGIGGTILGTMN